MTVIFPIVEGHGEATAVPILLRRIFLETLGRTDLDCLKPHRLPRNKLEAPGELERAVELGARKIKSRNSAGLILVLMDADDACPAATAPAVLSRISRHDVACSVVFANREFESWFLVAARSLRSDKRVRSDAEPPSDPESIRGAKEALGRMVMVSGAVYRPAVDQPALTARMDLAEARQAPSFDKLCRDIESFAPPEA
ncbi:MAG: DUF4276 family protein [Azospirillaceae bacterium]